MRIGKCAEIVAVQQLGRVARACNNTCTPRVAIASASSGSIERYGVTPVPVAIST